MQNEGEPFVTEECDNWGRLVNSTVKDLITNVAVTSPLTLTYDDNGNITTKSDIEQYKYPTGPGTNVNAVTSIKNSFNVISHVEQDITYTSFEKAKNITEGVETAIIYYGPDQERIKVDYANTTTLQNYTRLYLNNYETDNKGGIARQIHYLNSPAGPIGMYVVENGIGSTYYAYSDHLGTPKTITDASGTIVAEQNFDPWGQRRNPPGIIQRFLIRRHGFTGALRATNIYRSLA